MKLLADLLLIARAGILLGAASLVIRLAPEPDPAAAEAARGIAQLEELLRQKAARD